jgi:glucokinase
LSSVVGVDLGGTKVAVAALRGDKLGESTLRPTDLSGSDALVEQLAEMVDEVRDEDLAGVGIGVPSVVDFASGRVISSVNIPLVDVPLRSVLGERLGVPVFVDNDATVAALAEAHDEHMRLVSQNLVILTVGTGIGGGIVLGGRIYRGATGGAAELGHTLIGAELVATVPEPTHFPQAGSLEALAAGHALDHMAAEAAKALPESALGRRGAGGEPVLGADAVRAARDGDAEAVRLVELWARRLGVGIANAINTFDPDEVVIGGGAAAAGDLLLKPAREVALGYVHPGLRGHARVRLAWHGLRSGVLGAALLAAHELETQSAPAESRAPTEVP